MSMRLGTAIASSSPAADRLVAAWIAAGWAVESVNLDGRWINRPIERGTVSTTLPASQIVAVDSRNPYTPGQIGGWLTGGEMVASIRVGTVWMNRPHPARKGGSR